MSWEFTCTIHVESVEFSLCLEDGGIKSQRLSSQGCVGRFIDNWIEVKLNVDGSVS
jgi:hypothetical protein